MSEAQNLSVVGIAGSPSAASRSTRLISIALNLASEAGAHTRLIELSSLPADALLARRQDPAVAEAIKQAQESDVLVVGTPTYRAAYSGQLKAFFDLFPPDGLAGVAAVLFATGAAPIHLLAIDHTLRPLMASMAALSVATAVYATDGDFTEEGVTAPVLERVQRSVWEALALARALAKQ